MVRVAQHGWGDRLREALASWRRALALLLCVSFLVAAMHPAAADLGPVRDGGGLAAFGESSDACGDPADDARGHCCACHHQVANVTFPPLTETLIASPARFAVPPTAAPNWPTSPPPKPPRA
ncbi:MAG: hypothetical protein JWR08_1912 [Enterovirga sp.]|jgi:hypothetical protein|nr:hypothetical protein [Enterovirga sp.]